MIARLWRGRTTTANAGAYHRHIAERVFPALAGISGHRGAFLLRREADGHIEFLAVTLWESMDAIREFAGDAIDTAVIEPGARAVLIDFDSFVRHFELAHAANCDPRKPTSRLP